MLLLSSFVTSFRPTYLISLSASLRLFLFPFLPGKVMHTIRDTPKNPAGTLHVHSTVDILVVSVFPFVPLVMRVWCQRNVC